MIDRSVAGNLEILRKMPVLRFRVIEGIDHADALDRSLRCSIHALRLRQAGGFKHGWCDVDHVMPLGADLVLTLNPFRPMDHHAIARAAVT